MILIYFSGVIFSIIMGILTFYIPFKHVQVKELLLVILLSILCSYVVSIIFIPLVLYELLDGKVTWFSTLMNKNIL